MKSKEAVMRYQFYGPTLHDGLEALQRERDRIQKCIDALTRCMERGILGCQHDLSDAAEDTAPDVAEPKST